MAKKRLDVAALSRGEIRCCLAIVIALPVYYIGSLIVESSSNFFPATSVQLYLNSFSKDFKNQNWSGNASFNWSRVRNKAFHIDLLIINHEKGRFRDRMEQLSTKNAQSRSFVLSYRDSRARLAS